MLYGLLDFLIGISCVLGAAIAVIIVCLAIIGIGMLVDVAIENNKGEIRKSTVVIFTVVMLVLSGFSFMATSSPMAVIAIFVTASIAVVCVAGIFWILSACLSAVIFGWIEDHL